MAKIKLKLVGRGSVDVPVPGTPVPLATTSTRVMGIVIIGGKTNAGDIYLGDSSVNANNCMPIAPGQQVEIRADSLEFDEVLTTIDLADLYIDAANAGDKVLLMSLDTEEVNY